MAPFIASEAKKSLLACFFPCVRTMYVLQTILHTAVSTRTSCWHLINYPTKREKMLALQSSDSLFLLSEKISVLASWQQIRAHHYDVFRQQTIRTVKMSPLASASSPQLRDDKDCNFFQSMDLTLGTLQIWPPLVTSQLCHLD